MVLFPFFGGEKMQQAVNNDFMDAFAYSGSSRLRELADKHELLIDDEEFFPGGHLTRYRINNSYQRGVQEIVKLSSGFSVITTSFEALDLQTTSYSGTDWIVLQCCVSGEYDIIINDGKPQRLLPGDCRLDILTGESTWTRRQIAATRYRYVGIFLRPEDLLLLLSAGERSRNTLVELLSSKGHVDQRTYTFPGSNSLIATVNEVAEFGDFGGLRPAFVKAKSIELLVFALNKARWAERNCQSLQQRATLSRRAKMAYEIKNIIDREFAVGHTLEILASRVGSNRTSVTQAFKAEYHKTPMEYLKYVRLSNAHEMLIHHEGGLDAIAEHVGYADTASFIRAYRKFFGKTPGNVKP
ncbi:helix-turn-helix transcriptional regulator [Oceanicoccus sagamiensis]|uniref:HTH araC/xylS-type domain-containing protein n=1 Tax=Oceanicoccus sagamiensis TaxID=716816 RepID=A0A1X9NDM7_9GAMM|nr:AraC family transcriptional regulator [Oceanicoccus sagamiensis]ARN75261.1 hypothetical protein BST96_14745 [Oceanicoccus sagamiensis]